MIMRYTKKNDLVFGGYEPISLGLECKGAILNKLGLYEDIDDDIGISWTIVHSALKNGIYWVYKAVEGRFIEYTKKVKGLSFNENGWFICEGWFDMGCPIVLYLKDYGKTWALTKEELE